MLVAVHVVKLLALDGHVLECAERGHHGSADPCSVLPVEIGEHIDVSLHGHPRLIPLFLGSLPRLLADLVVKALVETGQERRAARENDVVVEVDLKIVVAFLNCLEGNVCKAAHL